MSIYISKLFICFIIFSFFGWLLEVIYGLYKLKKYVNRGYLISPLCPIYGVSCVLLYVLLSPIKNPIVVFLLSALICLVVEYLVSLLLEKIFNIRWWDYDYMKLNINGRICLEMSIPFGLLGLLSVNYLIPNTLYLLDKISVYNLYIISILLLLFFLVDTGVSTFLALKFKKNKEKRSSKDNTIEVTNFKKKVLKK